MSLFNKLKDPIFYKDDSDAEKQLSQLLELLKKASGDTAKAIEHEIMLIKAGIAGEKQVRFELENSHIPMYVLHDLYLENKGLTAQIDYLLITRRHQFIIECKNLFGDIEITGNGDFIRTFYYGSFRKKEGVYSPITQNRRHMELIKQIRLEQHSALIKPLFEKNFFQNYRSVVVLSNPKTVLNARYAKKEIRNQVIRADQLADYIRKVDSEPGSVSSSDKEMEELAKFFLEVSKSNPVNYAEKYLDLISPSVSEENITIENKHEVENCVHSEQQETIMCPKCGAPMVKRKAKKGINAGSFFYGCSNYPKCRSIINIG